MLAELCETLVCSPRTTETLKPRRSRASAGSRAPFTPADGVFAFISSVSSRVQPSLSVRSKIFSTIYPTDLCPSEFLVSFCVSWFLPLITLSLSFIFFLSKTKSHNVAQACLQLVAILLPQTLMSCLTQNHLWLCLKCWRTWDFPSFLPLCHQGVVSLLDCCLCVH